VIEYLSQIFLFFGINVILAASLNVINGYCGLFSLGHAGFYAMGAYTAAAFTKFLAPEFTQAYPYLALLMACLIGMSAAGLAGLVVGIPCLRLTGDYLAIATIGFSEIIRIVINNMDYVGAARGLPGIARLTDLPSTMIAAAFTLIFIYRLIHSSFGRSIIAIREDEIAARSMGVNVRFYKTFSFVVAALFAGLAGALFAHFQQFLHPSNFDFMVSVSPLLMIVIGGIGTLRGAVLGAFIVTLLPELLRFVGRAVVAVYPAWDNAPEFFTQIRMLIFGVLLVLMMLGLPNGLMSVFIRKKKNSDSTATSNTGAAGV